MYPSLVGITFAWWAVQELAWGRPGAYRPSSGASTTYEWILEHARLLAEPERWRRFYATSPAGCHAPRAAGDPGRERGPRRGRRRAGARADDGGGGREERLARRRRRPRRPVADRGLLDEILVAVAPVTLGAGAPLLPRRLTSSRLELVDVARDGQFARLSYRVRP